MSRRVDPTTKLCREHGAPGCADCMVADFREALAQVFLDTVKRKKDAQPVDERFDIGGEG